MQHNVQLEADRWLKQAEEDLKSAHVVRKSGLHHWVCFMCQQSGEKALYAFLYAQQAEDVWGHSLADLCEDAKHFDTSFEMIKSVAILLDKYYYVTRYPSQLPGGISSDVFTDNDSSKAIEIAEEVLNFVKDRLGKNE